MGEGSVLKMPPGFLWGAATAAYQNEGDNHNSQWASWELQPGRIYGGHRCGHATGWRDLETAAADFDRAAELGLNSLRLSVEWSRVEPEEGVFDDQALCYYQQLIGLLCERGIKPMVTLHHFTDPLWLTRLGAWENPRVVDFFARFVTRVVDALGDQVDLWCTINEPIVYAHQGFLIGIFPPGARSVRRMSAVMRHMLLGHGRAYRLIHRLQNNAQVGLAHHLQVMLPANPANSLDRKAAGLLDQFANRATLEAITSGKLTPLLGYGQVVPQLIDSSDYIGLNFYTMMRVAFDITRPGSMFGRRQYMEGGEFSDLTREGHYYSEIEPGGMYQALKQVAAYKKPIYITENGVPDHDDDLRPRYIATYLAEAWRAIQDCVDLRGYYHWTLVDNFEWCEGWNLRFGLIAVDPETGARTPKASAGVYQRIVQANGIPRSVLEKIAPAAVPDYFAG